MKDITNQMWIIAKGILFLALGTLAAVLVLLEDPSWKIALLLVLAIWCFCRSYYFAFYVIQKYVDPNYRYSGLYSFIRYMLQHRRNG